MDSPNSSPDQEKQGEQQPNELPILKTLSHNLESSDHVPPLVSEILRLRILWLTIVALPFETRRSNKTYFGDRAISTHLEGASRPRTRRSQVYLSSCSTYWALSTSMGVVRFQAHQCPEARPEQSELEGGWYVPEKREGRSSASPREAASSTALFRKGIGIISGTTD
jgi:hypothetical protein